MFALVTESVYSVYKLSYAEYMNTQQRINLDIYRKLSEEGIEIAHQAPLVTAAPGDQAK
jgi:small-conductance mechanosensitive channel